MPARFLLTSLVLALSISNAYADILLSIGTPGGVSTTIAPSADQQIPVFISSDAGDLINGLALNFDLPSELTIDSALSQFATTNGTNPGFFGDGEVFASTLESTTTMGVSTRLNTNLEFIASELVPGTPVSFFALNVDASGLAPGTYSIDYDTNSDGAVLIGAGITIVPIATNSLTFSVAAIPEPSSFAFVALMGTAFLARRHRA